MASRALSILSLLALAAGYSFDLVAPPKQCGPLSLKINGGSGKPPYTALIVPYGANPNPGHPELRTVISKQFSDDTTSFPLPYPANSNFVIMLGDTQGINTGGTSVPTTVGTSNDQSCLPNAVSVQFSFQILPQTAINQCTSAILAWNSSAQDPVSISLIIPGGQSQNIPLQNVGKQDGNTIGFSWTPNIPAGTNIILVANDKRGPGTGGSVNTVVGNNVQGDNSCLSGQSPSSTAGTPAGAIQTGGGGGGGGKGGGDNDGSGSNTGAIVGGVIGGIAALLIAALVAWFLVRRRRQRRHPAVHGVDLLPEGAQRDHDQPAEFYTPEPFIVPPAQSHAGAEENGGTTTGRPSMSDAGGRRYSALSTEPESEFLGVGVGAASTSGPSSSRKSPAGAPQLRPVNFVQHEDAGEVDEDGGGGSGGQPAETIELPPSYTSVRR